MGFESLVSTLVISAVIIATITDLAYRKIPNWLTLCTLITGITVSVSTSGLTGLATSLGGVTVGLALFLPVYLLGKMGAGDVKLMAAIGAFVGPAEMLWISALTIIAGAIFGVVWLVWHKGRQGAIFYVIGLMTSNQLRQAPISTASESVLTTTDKTIQAPTDQKRDQSEHLPYAVAILCGVLVWQFAQ